MLPLPRYINQRMTAGLYIDLWFRVEFRTIFISQTGFIKGQLTEVRGTCQ